MSLVNISLTGHYPSLFDSAPNLKLALSKRLDAIIREALTKYDRVNGHSAPDLWVGTMWSSSLVDARRVFPQRVQLFAHTSSANHPQGWGGDQAARWDDQLKAADRIVNYENAKTSPSVTPPLDSHAEGLHKRNQGLVDSCDLLIAVYSGIVTGGVCRTVQYAEKKQKPVLLIDPQNPEGDTPLFEGW